MKMLNWGALIGEREEVKTPENEQKSPASGELPHCFTSVSGTVGKEEPSNGAGCKATSPLSPPSPLKKQGAGLEVENEARTGGGASDKFSAENTHPVSPVAVCLLLECCGYLKASKQEITEALLMLKFSTPAEQVRAWAGLCKENDIDSDQVQQLAMPSLGQGVACRGCSHLAMDWVRQVAGRRVFRWVCGKQHALLELGFAGERVMIPPPECNDYAGRS
jgi:hypothetical protein